MENEENKRPLEIGFFEIGKILLSNKRKIIKITLIFFLIGLFIALFSPKEFTSSVTMVPQSEDVSSTLGGLSGLAAMAGVNIADMSSDALPPTIYPQIMESVPFQKDLMNSKIKFDNLKQPVSLFDYFTNDELRPFNMMVFLKKYTIGLPDLILKAFQREDSLTKSMAAFLSLSKKEEDVIEILKNKILLVIDEKEGTLVLTAKMPDAYSATQVVEIARKLLQNYIINFKIEKAKQNLDFINERYLESKKDFEIKQHQLALFRDANKNVISAISKTQEEILTSEFNLTFNIYSELAKQLEQAKIKVKDATPVLSIIKPAFIPNKKSKPKRVLILFSFTFLGFALSFGYLIFLTLKTTYKN